ncbi:ATP-binding protein [Clostridium sp.]|jgi:signal transduction histidine kinase|uniref:sensor histidine kinase n=1 Tax=Clostridium sp. TaxID=1506 RepID=UPI00258C01AE|nr:ATP-binding protein [Clostridium sp.]MDF2503345.1 signal transduction histidine kinase [Clostridium sp.]
MNNKNPLTIFRLIKLLCLAPIIIFRTISNLFNKLIKTLVKRLRFSITFKISTVYTVIFVLMLMLLNMCLLAGFTIYQVKNIEDITLKNFQLISYDLKNNIELSKNIIAELSTLNNTYITIFDEKHKVIYTTERNSNSITFYDRYNTNGAYNLNSNYLLYMSNSYNNTNNLKNNNASSTGYLIFNDKAQWNSNNVYIQITHNLWKEALSVLILFFILLIIDLMFIATTIIIGSRASKKMLKPVENMTNTVKNITVNALDTRLDISGSQDELKDLAKTFNRMLDRIQDSYERQNQFVSDASHELRTPISVIQGYSNLLSRWGKNDKAVLEESIDAIKVESENMKNLIEKLLFLARGDKNTQKIEMENFYINELIYEIIKETKLIDNSHEIINTRNDELMLNADPRLIKEALRIFIDNSIKYTPDHGTITINCFQQNNEAIITIEDTGMGIPKEDLPNIFNRFYRADKSRTKKTGGTGLGLSIAKWIILKHRGSIDVQSKIDIGTKITVSLPIFPAK